VDITLITSLVGALGIGSLVTNQVTSWRQRKEKREEREATRDETHRDQLRRAYSEFISAYSKFLDAGSLMHSINRAIDELPHDAYVAAKQHGADDETAWTAAEHAVAPEFRERGRRGLEDFAAASTDANTKGVALLLIDDDAARRQKILVLANAQLSPPQSKDDYARFHQDLLRLRAALDEVIASLGGVFSPDLWHQEVAERRKRIAAKPRRDLPPVNTAGALPERASSNLKKDEGCSNSQHST
jgi:hypothetical protein